MHLAKSTASLVLLKNKTQCQRAFNPKPLNPESDTLSQCHCSNQTLLNGILILIGKLTRGPMVNAHLRSAAYTNKTCLNIMVFNPSAGADEALGPFSFFQNNQYSVNLPISCWLFPSNDILTVFPFQMHGQPMLTLP